MAGHLDRDVEEFVADVQKLTEMLQSVDRGESQATRKEVRQLETRCIQQRDRLKKHPDLQSLTKDQKKRVGEMTAKLDKARAHTKGLKFADELTPGTASNDDAEMGVVREQRFAVKKMATNDLAIKAQIADEERRAMLRIEGDLETIHELYQDLDEVVTDQGKIIDEVVDKVGDARQHVKDGTGEVQKARDYAGSSRKKYICVCIILMVLVGLVVLLAKMADV